MNVLTTLKLAFRALWRNKVRSMLTMLGIIFGIGTVIAMVASGQGAQEAVADVFRAMGTNLLIVTNGSQRSFGAAGGAGSRYSLTWEDEEALENGEVPSDPLGHAGAPDPGPGRGRRRELEHHGRRHQPGVLLDQELGREGGHAVRRGHRRTAGRRSR